jgi:hypothetical protein
MRGNIKIKVWDAVSELDRHFVACISFSDLETCIAYTPLVFIVVVVIIIIFTIMITNVRRFQRKQMPKASCLSAWSNSAPNDPVKFRISDCHQHLSSQPNFGYIRTKLTRTLHPNVPTFMTGPFVTIITMANWLP